MEVQTRSESNGIQFHQTFSEALAAARNDSEIWKISFSLENGERVRLVSTSEGWTYENVVTGSRTE